MSNNQREKFQRAIEDSKRNRGKGNSENLSHKQLSELADEIKRNYK